MMRTVIMFVFVLVVLGADAFMFFWFFRRLGRIEEERWGTKAAHGRNMFMATVMRGSKATTPAPEPVTHDVPEATDDETAVS